MEESYDDMMTMFMITWLQELRGMEESYDDMMTKFMITWLHGLRGIEESNEGLKTKFSPLTLTETILHSSCITFTLQNSSYYFMTKFKHFF